MDVIARYAWVSALAGLVLLGGSGIGAYALGGRMDGAPTWLAVAGAVLLLLYPVLDQRGVQKAVSSRGFQLGSGSGLMVALVAGIAVALYLVAERNDHTWDLTRDAKYTLADQTIQVVSGLTEPVEVLAFFRGGSPGETSFRSTASLLAERTDKLPVTFVDPLRSPRKAEQHEITGDHGTVLLVRGEREQRLEWPFEEERLTKALLLLTSEVEHTVCWSMGHGEPDPDDEYAERALGAVVTELDGLNYQVVRQQVAATGIPRSCEALVIARPQVDWLPYELEALAAFVGEGGGVLVLLEPMLAPGLADELERYGVSVGDDVVLDLNPNNQLMGVNDPSFVVLSGRNLLSHPVTDSLTAAVLLPIARSVSPVLDREGLSPRALLQTSPDAWGERNPEGQDIGPDPDELSGEVPVAVVVEVDDPSVLAVVASTAAPDEPADDVPVGLEGGGEPSTAEDRVPEVPDLQGDVGRAVPADYTPAKGGRLVVIGDSDFATNAFVGMGNNRDLFLNAVAWLVEEEGQLGQRPEKGDTLEITTFGEAMVCIVSVLLVPGGAMLLAFATLLRRRYL